MDGITPHLHSIALDATLQLLGPTNAKIFDNSLHVKVPAFVRLGRWIATNQDCS